MKKIIFSTLLFTIVLVAAISVPFLLQYIKPATQGNLPKKEVENGPPGVSSPTSSIIKISPSASQGTGSSWILVRDLDKIILIPNFSEMLSSKEASKKNGCLELTSGGFIDTERNPIGLFISENQTFGTYKENQTFNGFFYITDDLRAIISSLAPSSPTRLALQTGPILVKNGKENILKLERDESARRVVAGTNRQGQVVFIIFYDKSNNLLGPKLIELPKLLTKLDEETSLEIDDAINLDGGSHSAFLTSTLKISEVVAPGSFFCIKP